MTLTYDEASKEMFDPLRALVKGELKTLLGYEMEMRWPFIPEPKTPKTDVWMRVSRQNVIEGQATFSECVGGPGQKRYTTDGLLIIQLFAPVTGQATILTKVGPIIRNLYRTLPNNFGLMYRNVRVDQNIPPEDKYYRLNVVAETEYDEIM